MDSGYPTSLLPASRRVASQLAMVERQTMEPRGSPRLVASLGALEHQRCRPRSGRRRVGTRSAHRPDDPSTPRYYDAPFHTFLPVFNEAGERP